MGLRDYQDAAQRIVGILGIEGARQLLRLLDEPDDVRADAFRQLYERGRHTPMLDALTDLESDRIMREWLAEQLRLVMDDKR
jgi:hypothetical protein